MKMKDYLINGFEYRIVNMILIVLILLMNYIENLGFPSYRIFGIFLYPNSLSSLEIASIVLRGITYVIGVAYCFTVIFSFFIYNKISLNPRHIIKKFIIGIAFLFVYYFSVFLIYPYINFELLYFQHSISFKYFALEILDNASLILNFTVITIGFVILFSNAKGRAVKKFFNPNLFRLICLAILAKSMTMVLFRYIFTYKEEFGSGFLTLYRIPNYFVYMGVTNAILNCIMVMLILNTLISNYKKCNC